MKTDVMTGERCEEMCAARDVVKAEVSTEKRGVMGGKRCHERRKVFEERGIMRGERGHKRRGDMTVRDIGERCQERGVIRGVMTVRGIRGERCQERRCHDR